MQTHWIVTWGLCLGPSLASIGWTAPFVYNFGDALSSVSPASAQRPWLTAEFADVAPGQVRLTVTASNLTAGEALRSLYLNVDPAINPRSLSFSVVEKVGAFEDPKVNVGFDTFKDIARSCVPRGGFDVDMTFATPGDAEARFGAGSRLVCLIAGSPVAVGESPALTAAAFAQTNARAEGKTSATPEVECRDPAILPAGIFYSLARIQGIGPCDAGAWICPVGGFTAVPEPAPVAIILLGVGAACCAMLSRRSGAVRSR